MKMKKASNLLSYILGAAAMMLSGVPAWGLSASHFASTSKLAEGKWVKIEIPADGVYELTDAELQAMGFSKPSEVRVYGAGACILPESLEAVDIDDLPQVPVLYADGKICFYGQGPMKRETYFSATANFLRYTINSYSSSSYYFITESSSDTREAIGTAASATSSGTPQTTSYNCFQHETELYSPGETGKSILGEDFGTGCVLRFDIELPNYAEGTQLNTYTTVGIKSSEKTELKASVNTSDVTFMSNSDKISANTSDYTYYNIGQARGTVTPVVHDAGKFTYTLRVSCPGTITIARLDNFAITYTQNNILRPDMSQLDMFILNSTGQKTLKVSGATPTTVVWNVTTPTAPKQYALTDDGCFTAAVTGTCEKFVAFDPERTLLKIKSFAYIDNQNLHEMSTPDMVIVTTTGLREQAQRIADMHASIDGMQVEVVEQDKIFNEFSSGAADATAIRMFMKMLYQRNPQKLKYLLLFGGGSFDNRQILGNHGDNLLITFQSTTSNVETKSYTCDDYFGMLADNTGYSIAAAPVTIAVGRMPVKTLAEAEASVDKLIRYVTSDFGTWRNNVLVMADEGDNSMHMYQAEGVVAEINSSDFRPAINKVFKEAYPLEGDYAINARKRIMEELRRGQLFVTYVGHGGPKALSRDNDFWRLQDSREVVNDYLPFFSFAACDVARFDSDLRGLAEELFHNPKGGMIAGMASTRTVFASENDELNVALVKNMFNLDENGNQRTIGEAYRMAKHAFDPYENSNKLNFMLIGDPAMKLHYPVGRIAIERVNDVDVAGASAEIYPMTAVKVSGSILTKSGEVDTDFSGKVTLSLYDKSFLFASLKMSEDKPVRDSYYQRELLSTSDCRAEAGRFEGTIMVPSKCLAQGEPGQLRAIAHRDDSYMIVDGVTDNVTIKAYSAAEAIADNEAPVIESMYLDSESFGNGDAVGSDPTLYATVTDNTGVSAQTLAIGNSIEVLLDNGTASYSEAKNVASVTDEGRKALIALPISNLSHGKHTLTLAASDIAGNRTSRSIDFFVQTGTNVADIEADAKDARESATFSISHNLDGDAVATVYVVDAMGKMVWSTTTDSEQCTWNLTDMNGKEVAPGRYRYYCTLRSATGYAASSSKVLVALARD